MGLGGFAPVVHAALAFFGLKGGPPVGGPAPIAVPGGAHAKCQSCLTAGEDFCIAEARCTQRGTFTCRGPHDHITGSVEFALHGNPRVKHSMVCPGEKGAVKEAFESACAVAEDKCMRGKEKVLDGECGDLWEKCGLEWKARMARKWAAKKSEWKGKADQAAKHGFGWVACKEAKVQCMRGDEKLLETTQCQDMWSKCGQELKEWKQRRAKGDVAMWKGDSKMPGDQDKKDCYFDPECHGKVDWERIKVLKMGMFARLKLWKSKHDTESVKAMMPKVHKMFAKAGMPEDRIDYILDKFVRTIFPEALTPSAMTPTPKALAASQNQVHV